MDKYAVLKFGDNSLGTGFPITLSIGNRGTAPAVTVTGGLPSDPDLYQLYATWATAYRQLGLHGQSYSDPNFEQSVIDVETCRNTAHQLSDRLNRWLQHSQFQPICAALMAELSPADDIQLLVQSDNVWLRRMPWHLWDITQRLPGLEIGLVMQSPGEPPKRNSRGTVRILAVVSNANDVDTAQDQHHFNQLPQAEVNLLVEPGLDSFFNALTTSAWDMVFLSGQRPGEIMGEPGRFYLNPSDSLSIDELSPLLEALAQKGLQTALVNSWDGMAIASVFEAFGIPHVIAMREPAPNRAAYQFFKSFLSEFAQGTSFYRSGRTARQSLDRLDAEFPCVSWLPIICQHPQIQAPRWYDWTQQRLSMTLPPLPDIETGDMAPAFHGSSSVPLPEPTEFKKSIPTASGDSFDLEQFVNEASPDQPSLDRPPGIPPASPSMPNASRSLIHHRYQIRKVLGKGGFGQTYLAIDTHRFDECCVLKQFVPSSRSEASLKKARELFQREAKVLYQINHAQIPKFLAWFTHDDNLFIVQEYIDGKSYLDLLRDRQNQGQTFSEAEVIQWLRNLLPVLGYIHSIGIVHRDISPANIMFSAVKQMPMLIDFGVVKEVVNQILSGQYSTFTHPPKATLVGKPGYSPPEQIQLGDCFPCSDFYALGMTAIVLLTGQDARTSRYQWRDHCTVSDALAQVIERMLAERPRERYQTAQAILNDLNQRVSPKPAKGIVPPPPPPPLRTQRRSPLPTSNAPSLSSPGSHPPHANTPIGQASRPAVPHVPTTSEEPNHRDIQAPALTADFIRHCEQRLSEYIGPVASFAVDDILAQMPNLTPPQFINRLAQEIPNPADAGIFKSSLQQFGQQSATEASSPGAIARPPELPMSSVGEPGAGVPLSEPEITASAPPPEPTLSLPFIHQCRQELARCIGPMANFIVDDVLDMSTNLTERQFVEAIAAEIPNAKTAEEFLQRFS